MAHPHRHCPGSSQFSPRGVGLGSSRVSRAQLFSRGAKGGAVDGLQADALKQPVAQIAANEAEHLSVFMRLSGRSPIGISLPRSLAIDQASNALDVFTS